MNLNNYNPSLKLVTIIFLSLGITLTYSLKLNIIIITISLAWLILSRVNIIKLLKINMFIIFFSAIFFISVVVFSKQNNTLSDVTYYNAYVVATKTMVFTYLGMLFSLTTKNIELLYSLKHQLKVPNVFVYGIFAAFNLFTDIKMQIKRNRVSFLARDRNFSSFSYKSIVPLLIKTMYYSDSISLAMESRGFNPNNSRTSYYKITIGKKDIPFIVVSCILFFLLFIL